MKRFILFTLLYLAAGVCLTAIAGFLVYQSLLKNQTTDHANSQFRLEVIAL